jgi:hypothetical protein
MMTGAVLCMRIVCLYVEPAFVSKVFGLAALYGKKFIISSLVTTLLRLTCTVVMRTIFVILYFAHYLVHWY